MNQKDLEYLREMAVKSETEDFSDEQLQKISAALRTNVNADDTTEALDLTARIINEQAQSTNIHGEKRNTDNVAVEKLHSLAKEVIYHGELLGAQDALEMVDSFDFYQDVKKENVTDKNAKRVRYEDGGSFLYESILQSSSPESIKTILDKGGKFEVGDYPSYELVDLLLYRVTDKEPLKNSEEKSVKNDLENMTILFDRGLADVPVNLDKLLSNPELFEKYPEIMKKMFNYDKSLLEKLEDVKSRKENKEINNQKKDYLQDKLESVRASISRRAKRKDDTSEETRIIVPRGYNLGNTGNSSTGEINEFHHRVADAQKNAAKEVMKKHLEEKHNR